MQRIVLSAALCFGGLLCLSGCGSTPPVQGVVTVDGIQLFAGTVKFYRENATKETAEGTVNGGTYSMLTGENPGVATGKYRVTVTPGGPAAPMDPNKKDDMKIPAKYQDVGQTPLTVTVVANPEPKAYDLLLTSK